MASMTPSGYDPEVDWENSGFAICDSCGCRIKTPTLEQLPEHECTVRQRENRALLAAVATRLVWRDAAGSDNYRFPTGWEPVDYRVLHRLRDAGLIVLPDGRGGRHWRITEKALVA